MDMTSNHMLPYKDMSFITLHKTYFGTYQHMKPFKLMSQNL